MMNRREFIKKAFGSAIALAIPSGIVAAEMKLKPTGNVFLKPEDVAKDALDYVNYYLGKGTLYVTGENGIEVEFPCTNFEIHTESKKVKEVATTPIEFSLDEFNQENLIKLVEGDYDNG